MADAPTGFLGRWSRRKTEALQGRPLAEPAATDQPAAGPVSAPVTGAAAVSPSGPAQAGTRWAPAAEAAPPPQPPEKTLSLDDVKALTPDADFKPFMAQGVGADVRNAAMKKLFADPHYNVMDGLDIYIDDYSHSDLIPATMLRQMASARFLQLFSDEEDAAAKNAAAVPADKPDQLNKPEPESPAPSLDAPLPVSAGLPCVDSSRQPKPAAGSGASPSDHAHPHLRLQPDHAPSAPHPGRGAS